MELNPIILSIPIFFILIIVELSYGYFSKKNTYRLGDAFNNIGCGILQQLTGLFTKVYSIGIYTYVYNHFRLTEIPNDWYFLILLFLGVDFFYYWAHRISHEINLFWLGHVVHHQSEDYNLSVALRQGSFQVFFTAPFYLPLAFAGFDPYWFLFILALNTLYQFWIHTEYIGKLGWFELIFNTPSHHRVHHGKDAKYIDKNHAGSLIIWDKMFGTFEPETTPPHYGITKPLNSFNPISAHLIPIKQLVIELKKGNSISDWIHILFNKPGWIDRKKTIPLIVHKFNPYLPHSKFIYILVHGILILGFTAHFLFTQKFAYTIDFFAPFLLILWSLLSLGILAESPERVKPEWIRLLFILVYGISSWPNLSMMTVCILIVLLSTTYLVKTPKLNPNEA